MSDECEVVCFEDTDDGTSDIVVMSIFLFEFLSDGTDACFSLIESVGHALFADEGEHFSIDDEDFVIDFSDAAGDDLNIIICD